MARSKHLLIIVLLSLCLVGCGKGPDPRQAAAAKNVTPLDLPGCPNAYRVSEGLYRGAQPSAAGFRQLADRGIRTVVNLRSAGSDRKALAGLGMHYVEIAMHAGDPKGEHVEQFLAIATDPNLWPVFVHCRHGADRTGAMVAAYRVVVQGWSKDRALEEMTVGPFGFHTVWRDLPAMIRQLDAEGIRRKLELPEPSPIEAATRNLTEEEPAAHESIAAEP